MIFQQEKKIDASDATLAKLETARLNFDVRQFAKDHYLGNPIAGNFYRAQYSEFLKDLIAADMAKATTTAKP